LIRPYIYAACDQTYYDAYASAFLNSARTQGHKAEVFTDHRAAITPALQTHYSMWRYRLLPELVQKHRAVLLLDVDSIVREPIEIEPEYDLGVFLRPDKATRPILGGIFYCTDRALSFAYALAHAMGTDGEHWGGDQRILWAMYSAYGHTFRVKQFDADTINWEADSEPKVFTAKGAIRRKQPSFMNEVAQWR
jgi:hypothetical protein